LLIEVAALGDATVTARVPVAVHALPLFVVPLHVLTKVTVPPALNFTVAEVCVGDEIVAEALPAWIDHVPDVVLQPLPLFVAVYVLLSPTLAVEEPEMMVLSSKNAIDGRIPDVEPVAETEYVATNVFGSVSESDRSPAAFAVASSDQLHVLPTLSFTYRCTISPGKNPEPEILTASPGEYTSRSVLIVGPAAKAVPASINAPRAATSVRRIFTLPPPKLVRAVRPSVTISTLSF
jgi:hypothetical protein